MKLLTLTLGLTLLLFINAGAVGTGQNAETTSLERSTLEAQLGRKLNFKERLIVRVVNKRMKKQAKRAQKWALRANDRPDAGVNKNMAVLGFIFGLVGITLGFIVPFVFFLVIPGLILSIIALNRASKNPEQYGGKGLAIAGIVFSGIGVFLMFLALADYIT